MLAASRVAVLHRAHGAAMAVVVGGFRTMMSDFLSGFLEELLLERRSSKVRDDGSKIEVVGASGAAETLART